MIIEGVLATTHLLNDGYKLTKEALDDFAIQINDRNHALPGNLEHDHTLPPIGKSIFAEVKPLRDGEYALVHTSEIFENPEGVRLDDGSTAFIWQSSIDSRPFKSAETELSDCFVITYSHLGFGDPQTEEDFLALVSQKPGFESPSQPLVQRSVDPGAVILVLLPFLGVIGTMTAHKLADRISDRFAEELVDLYDVIRAGVIGIVKERVDHFRAVTVEVTSRGIPEVEWVARVSDADAVISALTQAELERCVEKSVDLFHSIDARRVQFILDESGQWEFNYLLTGTGQVIGSPMSYTRQVQRLEAMDSTRSNQDNNAPEPLSEP